MVNWLDLHLTFLNYFFFLLHSRKEKGVGEGKHNDFLSRQLKMVASEQQTITYFSSSKRSKRGVGSSTRHEGLVPLNCYYFVFLQEKKNKGPSGHGENDC